MSRSVASPSLCLLSSLCSVVYCCCCCSIYFSTGVSSSNRTFVNLRLSDISFCSADCNCGLTSRQFLAYRYSRRQRLHQLHDGSKVTWSNFLQCAQVYSSTAQRNASGFLSTVEETLQYSERSSYTHPP